MRLPKAKKTGTTICGVVYKVRRLDLLLFCHARICALRATCDIQRVLSVISLLLQDGVVLGADTRATEGTTVCPH